MFVVQEFLTSTLYFSKAFVEGNNIQINAIEDSYMYFAGIETCEVLYTCTVNL